MCVSASPFTLTYRLRLSPARPSQCIHCAVCHRFLQQHVDAAPSHSLAEFAGNAVAAAVYPGAAMINHRYSSASSSSSSSSIINRHEACFVIMDHHHRSCITPISPHSPHHHQQHHHHQTINPTHLSPSSSCQPTAVQTFNGSRLQLRAVTDIPAGEEVMHLQCCYRFTCVLNSRCIGDNQLYRRD